MEFIRNFELLSKDDVLVAGGKGASLGEMTQAGIVVPPGFVVLSGVFDAFIESAGLGAEIRATLDLVRQDEMHTIEDASALIQSLIVGAEMPAEIREEIVGGFSELGCEFVAVRSSATVEDGASAAWAGQLDSYLNTTSEDLIENVQKCWASLFTPRAIFYRFEQGLEASGVSVAVVVQKMVESEKSGVAFSVHPVTEDYNQIIIEGGFGLGEMIVSGAVTPDSYVVDKRGFEVISADVAQQGKAMYRGSDGGNVVRELGVVGEGRVLEDGDVVRLAKMVVRIEEHYGFPCDIEWAFEGGELYILQSRPITTLSGARPSSRLRRVDSTLVESNGEESGEGEEDGEGEGEGEGEGGSDG